MPADGVSFVLGMPSRECVDPGALQATLCSLFAFSLLWEGVWMVTAQAGGSVVDLWWICDGSVMDL